MAQLVMCPTLDLVSGHDLMVCEFEPHMGLCAESVEPAWDSLSASPLLAHSHSLKINKQYQQKSWNAWVAWLSIQL